MTSPAAGNEPERDDQDESSPIDPADVPQWVQRAGVAIGVVVFLTAVGLMVATGIKLWTESELPMKRDPGFLDLIFNSRATVFAARAAVIAAAAFVIYSVIGLMWKRQFITEIAGIKVSEPVRQLEEQNEQLIEAYTDLAEQRDALIDELGERDQLINDLLDESAQLEAELKRARDPADT